MGGGYFGSWEWVEGVFWWGGGCGGRKFWGVKKVFEV